MRQKIIRNKTNNIDDLIMSKKEVPPDLLPMYPRDYDEEWARKTVQYREVFCPYDNNRIPNNEDVISWIRILQGT